MAETRKQRRDRLRKLAKKADESFNGEYKNELDALLGLSKDEIDFVTPDTVSSRTYSVLLKVVEEASRKNLTQAELVEDIKELGDVAVKIAKKIPKLASLLNTV
jgi:DNA-binding transcriptional ArsR family regulator